MRTPSGTLVVVTLLLALIGAILAFIFIIPEKRRAALNGFGKFLHDLCNFKFLIIEKILQFLYVFVTAWVLLIGLFSLFQTDYYGDWVGYIGLVYMVLGPIFIRIVYELLMMAIIAIKNIIQINNKLKNQNEGADDASPFGTPIVNDYTNTPTVPMANDFTGSTATAPMPNNYNGSTATVPVTHSFCPKCGSIIGVDGRCINPDCDK